MQSANEIIELEARLRQAMLLSDAVALDKLLSDDVVFTNQDGARLSKSDDLAAHQSGCLKIERLEARGDPLIQSFGDSAIVSVIVEVAGTFDGGPFGSVLAYSRVWRRRDGCWQIAMAHCSAVKAAPVVA